MIEELRLRLVGRFLNHADGIVGVDCMVRISFLQEERSHANYKIASTFQNGLVNGGPAVLVYGLILTWVGILAVNASLAEMASMQVIQIPDALRHDLTGPGRLLLVANIIGSLNLRLLGSR